MTSRLDIHKDNWFKSVIKHGKWYLLSSVFTKGINFLLLPVYTRYLSPTDYGILSSLNSIALLLPIFVSLYLDSAFGRFFHDMKHDQFQLKKLFSTIYWFVVIYGLMVVSIFLIASNFWLERFLNVPMWPYAYLAFIPSRSVSPVFISYNAGRFT